MRSLPAAPPPTTALLLMSLLAPAAHAADAPDPAALAATMPGVSFVTEVEGIAEYELDNGLQILLFRDASRPTVTVNCTVYVGSRHEGYGETGMAHLLEHMVFKGTPDHPNVPKALQDRGARFNGSTWLDRTNYYETLPASDDNLQFAIDLEADRLVNSYVKEEDLDSEMTVVRNEFERGENSPQRVLLQRMMSAAFDWHNYGKSTIGNRADIERVPIENLKAFYKKFYQPDNAILIVAGSFDPAKALAYAAESFGSIEVPDRELPETYTEEPAQDGERTVVLRRVGDVAQVGAVYHVPAGSDPTFAAVEVLQSVLADTPSGRLYKSLVETKRAASIFGTAFATHDPGVLIFGAEVAAGNDAQDVLGSLLDVTEGVADDPITEEEVDRARRRLLKQRELAADDTTRIAVELSEWAAQGDWRLYFLYRDRLEEVTAAQVQGIADAYLERENRTAGLFLPSEDSEKVTVPARMDLAEMLEGYRGREVATRGEAFDTDPTAIEQRVTRTELPSGLEVALLPKQTRGDSVTARLTLRFGNVDSLSGAAPAADLLGPMLLRGTTDLTRQEIQDEIDRLGARVSASSSAGAVTFTISTKRDRLTETMALVGKLLRDPTFPQAEVDILKNQRVAAYAAQQTEPQALAPTAVQRHLSAYPDPNDVRYTPTPAEQVERAESVTRDEVQRLYRDFLSDATGQLAVVGSFDPAEVLEAAAESFTGWAGDGEKVAYARIPRAVNADAAGGSETIETPDKQNAVYFAGLTLPISDDHPDYPALLIGNYVLGAGSLSSRLGDRVRQQEGLSYGVSSNLSARATDEYALFYVYAITNPDNAEKLLGVIREELDRLLAEGITADELEAAKNGYLQGRSVARAEDSSLASTLVSSLYNDRTLAFTAEREAAIEALTVDEVNAALREHLDADDLYVVVAGDLARN